MLCDMAGYLFSRANIPLCMCNIPFVCACICVYTYHNYMCVCVYVCDDFGLCYCFGLKSFLCYISMPTPVFFQFSLECLEYLLPSLHFIVYRCL